MGRNDGPVSRHDAYRTTASRATTSRPHKGAVAVRASAASGRSADMTSLFGLSLLLGLILGLAGLLRLISP